PCSRTAWSHSKRRSIFPSSSSFEQIAFRLSVKSSSCETRLGPVQSRFRSPNTAAHGPGLHLVLDRPWLLDSSFWTEEWVLRLAAEVGCGTGRGRVGRAQPTGTKTH